MEKKEESSSQNDVKMFKGVAISLFWALVVLISDFVIFEFALKIMSAPSTLVFMIGVVLIAFCVLATIAFFYLEVKKMFNKNNSGTKPEENTKPEEKK
ncbi:MAG: hypothetical protein IPJ01_11350 [Micavibrio sp.]|nr:hypothetical protein [Micavibrio sp.]